ncbi:MAG: LuxR C-terminal-related transcriptional regulator [Oscillospiraceae bacterium]|nr:LuxR C-terminal-related transcriptional regulator [Oscillospiraceae bacterium]
MAIAYVITSLIGLLLMIPSFLVGKQRSRTLILLSFFVFLANLGWLLTTQANSLETALMANRIAYLGNVFLPLCLLLLIGEQCGMPFCRSLKGVLIGFSLLVFLVTASPGYSTVYYSTVDFKIVAGSARLIREYGLLHNMYYLYLFGYFGGMLAVILLSARKGSSNSLQQLFLLSVVLGNVMIWLVEQFIPREFEFLSISYLLSETLLLLLLGILAQQTPAEQPEHISSEMEQPLPEATKLVRTEEDTTLTPERIEALLLRCEAEYQLSPREKDVLRCLLTSKKRKDIAEELYVTESTIKKYTTQIYRKLSVSSRMELYLKLNDKM